MGRDNRKVGLLEANNGISDGGEGLVPVVFDSYLSFGGSGQHSGYHWSDTSLPFPSRKKVSYVVGSTVSLAHSTSSVPFVLLVSLALRIRFLS